MGEFEFSLREFAGHISVNGFDPSGLLVMLGLTNIVLALVYKLPLPVQPKKAVGSIAIAKSWASGMAYGTGLSLGIFWLFLGAPKRINKVFEKIPNCVTKGIRMGICIILLLKAIEFMRFVF